MKDLFGWGGAYVDKYAGLGNFEKYKKLVSKANVDMVLNHFTPFTKTRALKDPTKTIISYDDSNIEATSGAVDFHDKGNKIYVNNKAMTERLDFLPPEDRDQGFIDMMKQAYVSRSEKESIKGRFVNDMSPQMYQKLDDPTTPREMIDQIHGMVEVQRQVAVAAQCMIQGVPSFSETSQPSEVCMMPSMDLAQALLSGKPAANTWAVSMMDELKSIGKTRSEYNKWMDNFKVQCANDFNTSAFDSAKPDKYETIMSDDIPLTRMYAARPKEKNDEKQGSGACKVGNGRMEYTDEPKFSETEKQPDKKYMDTNDVLEYDELAKTDRKYFFRDDNEKYDLDGWRTRDAKMEVLAEALYESLVGKMGRVKSQNPSKRLNTRSLVSDISDNIYVSKHQLKGKELHINLILDTSGSMGGTYISDGVDIINCVNKIAQRGVITGNLMLSCSGASSIMKLPIAPDLLPRISAHNGGEGFRHTFAIRWQELKAADFNLAITDGQLTDGAISKDDFLREGISVTGLYCHRGIAKDKAQAVKYNGSLSRWFDKSAVRSSAEEAIYFLVDNAILNYDMKGAA